jgi:hypothetical protein
MLPKPMIRQLCCRNNSQGQAGRVSRIKLLGQPQTAGAQNSATPFPSIRLQGFRRREYSPQTFHRRKRLASWRTDEARTREDETLVESNLTTACWCEWFRLALGHSLFTVVFFGLAVPIERMP